VSTGADRATGQTRKETKTAILEWTPEDIMNAMHGLNVPAELEGVKLLLEVGQMEEGWIMDFTQELTIISRYPVPPTKAGKKPSGPPKVHSYLQSIPWVWYKNRKIFSKIESGKLSDGVAFVTGKIGVSGDSTKFDLIETIWKDAKEIATESKKKRIMEATLAGTDIEYGLPEDEEKDDDDDEEEVDEEARILATFKPEIEPTNPLTKAFWRRHFGTDALVSSYLFLLSTIGYQGVMLYNTYKFLQEGDLVYGVPELSKLAHDLANTAAASFSILGSLYFIKMSYPEVTMIMMYRATTVDPETMGFMERYFTANEFLIALWLFCFAFLIPYFFVIVYEFFWLRAYVLGLQDVITFLFGCLFSFIFNIGVMPDGMRMNNGKGSSFFFDYCWAPLLFLKCTCWCQSKDTSSKRTAFWRKHVGIDMLATAWIFAVLGVVGSLSMIPLVYEDPHSIINWITALAIVPFGIGSLLLLRASYPEYMNSSFCCHYDLEDDEDEIEIDTYDAKIQADSSSPLLI